MLPIAFGASVLNINKIIHAFLLTLCIPVYAKVEFYRFPISKEVEHQVKFWHEIFAHYQSSQSVIHDKRYPNIIIDVIDYPRFRRQFNKHKPYTPKEKKHIKSKYIKRYLKAIRRFQTYGEKAVDYGPMEQRILKVYKQHPEGLNRLLHSKNKIELRSQAGLADEFEAAAFRAKNYMPYIEDIFRKHNIPIDLARLTFVESMFNLNAVSKVGAAGVWQFMKATAKQYILVDKSIDERRSPLKASLAAAKFLADNYRALNSWPLAITAYNHGPNGMIKAKRSLRTNDLGKIIKNYKSSTFGFASKNFYAEFLAANIVYKKKFRRFNHDRNPLNIQRVKLKKATSIQEIMHLSSANRKDLYKYNKCIDKHILWRKKHFKLPRNYELYLPIQQAEQYKRSAKKLARNSIRNRGESVRL